VCYCFLGAILLVEHYIAARPYLYHLTHRTNLPPLRQTRRLFPAAILLQRSGRVELMRTPRRRAEPVVVDGMEIMLRDQGPLHKGSMQLSRGDTFEGFVEILNDRVFFWPGHKSGPISYGIRHFEAYKDEQPAILRVRMEDLLNANPNVTPLFCRFNSGSPRCSYGKKSPRGRNTFVTAPNFGESPGRVVEVTFPAPVVLPPATEHGSHLSGPWRRL
jgi:hypothetical protein